MKPEDFRALAMAQPGAVESGHVGHPDFRWKGRVFASLEYPAAGWGMVKLTPEQQRACLQRAPEVFVPANGAWGRAGSTTIWLEAAREAEVKPALAAAFANLAAGNGAGEAASLFPLAHSKGSPAGSPPFLRRTRLLRFPGGRRRDPAIAAWMAEQPAALAALARPWFRAMRQCGAEVRELLHDGHPTACVGDAGFGYVNAFKDHVNVGFFRGADLSDPEGLLEGSGRSMRHVKLRPRQAVDAKLLQKLIAAAFADMQRRVRSEGP